MENDFDFLEKIPKEPSGLFIVYELFTFDNFFRLLLKDGLGHEEALSFILSTSSLSALVFQERIHNEKYKKLSQEGALPYECAFSKAQLIYDLFFENYGSDPKKG
jgi:hypothetical protein